LFRRKNRILAILLTILLVLPFPALGVEGQVYQNPPREEIAQKFEKIAKEKNIPGVILKTLAFLESGWRQFDSNGNPLASRVVKPALGIMQIASYDPNDAELIDKLKYDIDFNISYGADLLNQKWNMVPRIGNGDRNILENWYFAIWAYNNWSVKNNPNNAAASGEIAYQDAFIRKAALEYFPRLVTPVNITPISPELLPIDTLPNKSQVWDTPEPRHPGDWYSQGSVLRIVGSDRIDTVNQVAINGWTEGTGTVIITRSDDFPDALAGVPLAKQNNAPILITPSLELNQGVISVINTLKPVRVIILGGEKAVSKAVETKLDEVMTWGSEIRRIAGADRYETAVLIAEELPNTGKIALATGADFPDALSLTSAAAGSGIPLLLTSPGELPEITKNMLKQLCPGEIYVAGGETAVSSKVLSEISGLTGIPQANIVRFDGSDRYETSVKIAEKFYPATQDIYLATGRDFADPLAAGALAATKNNCLLLVAPTGFVPDSPAEKYLEKLSDTTNIRVVGSEENITEGTVNRVKQLLGYI